MTQDDATQPLGTTPAAPPDATLVLSSRIGAEDAESAAEQIEQIDAPEFARRFEFICNFASGGMGRISKARDIVFNRVVAVKSLKEPFNRDPHAIRAFIEECRLNARLDHPSIVPIYAMGRGRDGNWEAVMKLINGASLTTLIRSARAAEEKRVLPFRQRRAAVISRLEYFLKACEVIEYCHSLKIVHGDIKPDNILTGQFGEVYVMDWGCARPFGVTPERLSGTPNYLPPEFLRDRKVTPQVDVFSLGMLLFELVTLRRGWNGSAPAKEEAAGEATRCDVRDPAAFRRYPGNGKISRQLEAIIRKAVHPDPARRYATVHELSADVRSCIYDEEVKAAPDNFVRKLFRILYRHRTTTVLVSAGIVLFFCGWLFLLYFHANLREQERTRDLMQRLKFQSYNDGIGIAVEKNFLLAQAQLLLFADNLIEDMQEPKERNSRFIDNEQYLDPATSPPGMTVSELYPHPVNLDYMVRIKPETPGDSQQELPGAKQYVDICRKILCYNLSSHDVNENRSAADELLSGRRPILRLFVRWANQVFYSYPGTREELGAEAFRQRWRKLGDFGRGRKIVWSEPYPGEDGKLHVNCRYPMYDRAGKFLGVAGLELRLDQLFEPVVRGYVLDPIHEFYYVDERGTIVTVLDDRLAILKEGETLPGKIPASEVIAIAEKLKQSGRPQLEAAVGKMNYFVSGAPIATTRGMLVQLIETSVMATHHHRD